MTLRQFTLWAMAVYPLIALVLGVRLLILWRRTRKLPELLFGLGFLFGGPIGNAALVLSRMPLPLHTLFVGYWGLMLIVIGNCGASLAKLVATWRIFRPDRWWAKVAVAVMAVVLVGAGLRWVTPYGFPSGAGYGGRALVYSWMATESFRYHLRLKRRMKLGLADPVVVDRFRLWGCSASSSALASLAWYLPILLHLGFMDEQRRTAVISVLGVANSVLIWLAFYPPRPYLRMIERRARKRSAPAAA